MFDSEDFLFLVMELTTGGELFDRIVAKGCYTEEEASQLVRKIVEAIKVTGARPTCRRPADCGAHRCRRMAVLARHWHLPSRPEAREFASGLDRVGCGCKGAPHDASSPSRHAC